MRQYYRHKSIYPKMYTLSNRKPRRYRGNQRKGDSMIKITVSYSEQEELQKVLRLLKPHSYKIKLPKTKKGEYKKAYITLS